MIRAACAVVVAAMLAASGCGSRSGAGPRRDAGRRAPDHDAGQPRDAGHDAGLVIERAVVAEPARARDEQSEGTEPVGVRRIVYDLVLAATARSEATLAPATAELRVDVSASRLRARFVGVGAPVEAGSEVRLQAGSDGDYLFDGSGGRPLGRGDLAAWLDGRARGVARGRVAVELDPPPPRAPRAAAQDAGVPEPATEPGVQPDPPPSTTRPSGSLVCALLADLAGTPRASLVRRCARGAPRAFTLGPWHGTRTVDVDVDLPAEALRSDDLSPPVRIERSDTRAFFAPGDLSRVPPLEGSEAEPVRPPPQSTDAPPEGLAVVNDSPSRAIITVRGVPMGWVGAGQTAHFIGLRAGRHVLGAISPLGTVLARPRPVALPARWVLR